MAFRRFRRQFEHDGPQGKVTYPRDWAGEVDEHVAALADAADATWLEDEPAFAGLDLTSVADNDLIAALDGRGLHNKPLADLADDLIVDEVQRRQLIKPVVPDLAGFDNDALFAELEKRGAIEKDKVGDDDQGQTNLDDEGLLAEIQRRGLVVPLDVTTLDDTVINAEFERRTAGQAGKPLDEMTKEELLAEAKRLNLTVSASDNKPEILAAVKAGQEQG